MKKIYVEVILLCLILYFAGTLNFYMGSNSQFFNTAFQYKGSIWHNEKHNLTAIVLDERTMEITDDNTKEIYILVSHGNKYVELFKKADYYNTPTTSSVFTDSVVYKKRFGKIYKFIIKGRNLYQWTASGNDDIVFFIKER